MLFPSHDLSIIEPNPVLPAKKKNAMTSFTSLQWWTFPSTQKKKDGNKNFPQSIFVTCERWGFSTPKTPPSLDPPMYSHHGVVLNSPQKKATGLRGFFGFLGQVLVLEKTLVLFLTNKFAIWRKTLKVKEWRTAALYPDLYELGLPLDDCKKFHQEICLPTMWCFHRWFFISWGLGGSQDQKKTHSTKIHISINVT